MSNQEATKNEKSDDLRIGVFVCHCGSNIAGFVDCHDIYEYAKDLDNVVYAKENQYTCSESGIAEIQQAIKEHGLNRVVVASCSPRTHQPLFSSSCAEAGLNKYLFEMVNIRDQCSWVHMQEKEKGTAKAKELIRMGVAKSRHLEPQQDIEMSLVSRALVIGGGIAGLSAAESLAGMGIDVVLVEKQAELGGLVKNLNTLAPKGDKGTDRIAGLIQKLSAMPNVKIYLSSTVDAVGGYIGNYEATILTSDQQRINETIGCIIVAIGATPLTPEGIFGYDGNQVITQNQLEEKLKSGSFSGSNIVMIQCAGARSSKREYCARICCMTAVKNALQIKQNNPQAQVHILYRDMQMYGTENENMLWEARRQGVKFYVYDPEKPPVVENNTVSFYYPLMGETESLACDRVVLSTPLVPSEDALKLSNLLRVPVDQYGFFLEAHAKLRPLDFATDGIFLCGSARYPANTLEARAQGLGAAARAASILFKDKLVMSAQIASIDAESCVGCMGCMDMCPFEAIAYVPEKGVCEINPILCKGCGNCASTCPSQSVQLKGYKPQQLSAQIRAIAESFV
ncbi:MAG: FAD-dependent oxidoreductase [Desulfobacterales bacterium]|jgi:heterodisulfide reductase subunit A|nr:FAD-dependent oxidoreductase [Desulfobacterales bacterium]